MRIVIQASDLDSQRIDGTRVYLLNLLNRFGKFSNDYFFIYHKKEFNRELTPVIYPNYKILKKPFPFYWTQTRFTVELWTNKYDRLWMPMQALSFGKPPKLNSTVTIHDLAFKYFPQFFPKKDLRRLNLFTDFAVKYSHKIIAVSQSTKNDILKFYPHIKKEKIRVIYHGFDTNLFQKEITETRNDQILNSFKLKAKSYILYVGAIQPRKNLDVLIDAFEDLKSKSGFENLKLVLAGGKAWMWENIFEKAEKSRYRGDIVITGTIPFEEISVLYKGASLFVFPSLYEGFGLPVLEALAAEIPVITAKNSSLSEVGGEAVAYFDNMADLSQKIRELLRDETLRNKLILKGKEQIKKFSWDQCAQETIEFIKS